MKTANLTTEVEINEEIARLKGMVDQHTDYIDDYRQHKDAVAQNKVIYAAIAELTETLKVLTVTIDNTTMEVSTMKDYTTMTWNEIVAYAKKKGINPGHKKRIVIEEELAAIDGAIITVSGDMTTDKYYPELQAEVTKPVLNMKQGYLIIKYLSNKGKTYKATALHGNLAQYNGLVTMKLSILRAIVANTLRMTEGEPTKERIDIVLDELVRLQYFGRAYSESNVPQFFINKDKCNALLSK